MDCMLHWKVGTGHCEASRVEAKCGKDLMRERLNVGKAYCGKHLETQGFRKP